MFLKETTQTFKRRSTKVEDLKRFVVENIFRMAHVRLRTVGNCIGLHVHADDGAQEPIWLSTIAQDCWLLGDIFPGARGLLVKVVILYDVGMEEWGERNPQEDNGGGAEEEGADDDECMSEAGDSYDPLKTAPNDDFQDEWGSRRAEDEADLRGQDCPACGIPLHPDVTRRCRWCSGLYCMCCVNSAGMCKVCEHRASINKLPESMVRPGGGHMTRSRKPTTLPDAPTPGCDSRKPRLTCLPRKARPALTEYHITVEKSAAASRDCGTIPHSSTERPWRKEEWLSCYNRSTATLTAEEWAEIWEGFLVED